MITINEHPEEHFDELEVVKVAPSTRYRHGAESKQRTISKNNCTGSCDIVIGPSRYKLEAMNKAREDTRVLTRCTSSPVFPTNYAQSSLLDVYEIERISKDIDHYIQCSCDKYYCHKSVDGVHLSGNRSIVPLPERDSSGTKAKRTSTQRKWFRPIYELCGSNKAEVVKNVGIATTRVRANRICHRTDAG